MSDPGVILPDLLLRQVFIEINHFDKKRHHSLKFWVVIGQFKTTAQRAEKEPNFNFFVHSAY